MIAGVSLSTVKKIAKEGRDIEDGQRPGFSTPNKRHKKSSKIYLQFVSYWATSFHN